MKWKRRFIEIRSESTIRNFVPLNKVGKRVFGITKGQNKLVFSILGVILFYKKER